MEFRILGPLEVFENGRQLDLGGAKQRGLVAILLLHANEVVSTDRLIDALWEDDAPETGRKALQVYVSQLRKTLGKERIATRSPGYYPYASVCGWSRPSLVRSLATLDRHALGRRQGCGKARLREAQEGSSVE